MQDSTEVNALGAFLRGRRAALDATALGYSGRRRTPGLRREEIAQRANISATWYTWLEQGRGGKPSSEVLDRITRALLLTDAERDHAFLLGVGHRPEPQYREGAPIPESLQHLLDALEYSPALVRTVTWDVVGWNRAALAVLTDYQSLSPKERNILRLLFLSPRVREGLDDWDAVARYVVAEFRAEATLSGAEAEVSPLVTELQACSPEFSEIWGEARVQTYGEDLKRIRHPVAGDIDLEFNSFTVRGRPNLSLLVYHPASEQSRQRVLSLVDAR